MVQFLIKPINGKTITKNRCDRHKHIIYWAVFFFSVMRDSWIFLKSFYTEDRAKNYVEQIKKQIAGGDYSCLTLKP